MEDNPPTVTGFIWHRYSSQGTETVCHIGPSSPLVGDQTILFVHFINSCDPLPLDQLTGWWMPLEVPE